MSIHRPGLSNIPKLNYTIERFNQGCIFFQRAIGAWQAGDLFKYETSLRTAATEAIGSLEWSLKVYLRSVCRDRIVPEDIAKLKQPNFDELMSLMSKYAMPALDSGLVSQLYVYRDLFRNAPEHDASVPPSDELYTAIQTVRELIVTYLPVDVSQLKAVSLPTEKFADKMGYEALAEQLRPWIETLGYRFEGHEVRTLHFFQWIIDVPTRRGFDRVLVHGVKGEAEIGDLDALAKGVMQQKTSEGWLVSGARVSQATRDAIAAKIYDNLFSYTFDELIDERADFEKYLVWLEAEIKSRAIDELYVPLACTKREKALSAQGETSKSRYDARNGWIEGYIDRWLDDPTKEHISVLGEFGTGDMPQKL